MKFDLTAFSAFCFAIPVCIIFFFGTSQNVQGVAYSFYLLPFIFIIRYGNISIPLKRFYVWSLFLFLWITPSIINFFKSTLESELLNLNILFFHVLVLSSIFIYFCSNNYLKLKTENIKFFSIIFFSLLPLTFFLIFKIILFYFLEEQGRFNIYGVHANNIAEILFTVLILSSFIKNLILKYLTILLTLLGIALCQSSAIFISSFIFLFIYYFIPWFLRCKYKVIKISLVILVSLFLITFLFFLINIFYEFSLYISQYDSNGNLIMTNLYNDIFNTSNHNFIYVKLSSIYERFFMYKYSFNLILENPIVGVGFWVNPTDYSLPNYFFSHINLGDPVYTTHNAFLRIASENGLPLLFFILIIIFYTIYKNFQNNNFHDLAIIISIIFFLQFSTRHLSLNLLNIIFYITIFKCLTNIPNRLKT